MQLLTLSQATSIVELLVETVNGQLVVRKTREQSITYVAKSMHKRVQ